MTMPRRTFIAGAATVVIVAAGPDPGIAVLEQLFQAPHVEAAWFTPDFLEKVPVGPVDALLDRIRQEMGAFQSVTGSGHRFTVHLAKGDVLAGLVLTSDGKISSLLLRPAGP
jgi:hypothetical protein